MLAKPGRGPNVFIPPPMIFVGAFLLALLIDRTGARIRIVPHEFAKALGYAGVLVALGGVAFAAWGMLTFARAHTAIIPVHPASHLVQQGPYRVTRNPMYLGMSAVYVGASMMFNSAWTLAMLLVVIVVMRRFVIRREERYLTSEFGDEYRDYCERVPRWI